jgi:putative hydrolase of the HAD superfamily
MTDAAPGHASGFKALIVDFGGVLTTPMQEAMERFSAELGIELQDLVRVALAAYSGSEDRLVTDFETGRISEEEFAAAFAARLESVANRPVDPQGLIERIFRLDIEEEMIDLIVTARNAGFKTGLCSNSWGTRLYPRARLDPIFDVLVISGEVGLRKPEAGIYELVSKKLGVEPAACIFVDDHPGHLAPALELGMTTVLHRSAPQTVMEVSELLGLPA